MRMDQSQRKRVYGWIMGFLLRNKNTSIKMICCRFGEYPEYIKDDLRFLVWYFAEKCEIKLSPENNEESFLVWDKKWWRWAKMQIDPETQDKKITRASATFNTPSTAEELLEIFDIKRSALEKEWGDENVFNEQIAW